MVVVLAVVAWALPPAAPAGASPTCDRVASPLGDDGNAGTAESPWRSAQHLVENLAPGQTGCFRAGSFEFSEIDIGRSGVTLTSYPGERATLNGTLKIEQGAEGVTVSDLNLDGRGGETDIGPFVFGSGATFDGVDVTNHHTEVCFMVGASNPAEGFPTGTVIENSRIHDCGKLPSENGDHGIYVDNAQGTVIRDNWIYDNADRGIQLYPNSQGAQVYGNVIDGNGEGVIISKASSDNAVYDNVISNSRIRWNVEAFDLHGTGNVVRDNCVWASNSGENGYYEQNGGVLPPGEGGGAFAASSNRVANPQFVDPASRDLNLRAGSPCLASSSPAISLRTAAKRVRVGSRVRLLGRVAPGRRARVTIQILRRRRWRGLARARVQPDGRFSVRQRLGGRLIAAASRNRVWLRAKLPRVGRSRPVAIWIRR